MTRNITLSVPLKCIENPAYLIPPGTYTLGVQRWSKSGKLVPILHSVPATPDYPSYDGRTSGLRTGILIHNGTRESHSHGCLLIPPSNTPPSNTPPSNTPPPLRRRAEPVEVGTEGVLGVSLIDSLVTLIQSAPKDEKVQITIKN